VDGESDESNVLKELCVKARGCSHRGSVVRTGELVWWPNKAKNLDQSVLAGRGCPIFFG